MNTFIWGLIFSFIGMIYLSIGKRLDKYSFYLFGILLIIYPYFVDGLKTLITVGVIFLIAPFVASRFIE